jgi:hypothetical protein
MTTYTEFLAAQRQREVRLLFVGEHLLLDVQPLSKAKANAYHIATAHIQDSVISHIYLC